jgi:hypothetical protein
MAYTLSPTTLALIAEDTNFARTVTIATDPADPLISDIIVTLGDNTAGNILVTTDTVANTIVISGRYSDNFVKIVNYLDAEKQPQTITSKTAFAELPVGYLLVNEYLASMSTSATATYVVTVNGANLGVVTQEINNNYTPGQTALIAAVAGAQV